jgi:aspartate ammonia-lyase
MEHDLLGERHIPAEAYWGIHTLRAIENFPISKTEIRSYPDLIVALAMVKQAAAKANHKLGLLESEKYDAIIRATNEIMAGRLHDQFVVDVIQGGAGTSTNMNANEVIANRALEFLGYEKGRYEKLHPIEDVNLSQSTNDVYPTAIRVALHFAICRLLVAMGRARTEFQGKAEQFAHVLKMGRTQLQDAVPMTLGQEFRTYAVMLEEDQSRLTEACSLIREVNLGGTAIGTGLNADPLYSELATRYLAELCGFALTPASDLIEATQDMGAFVQLSGVLKRIAVKTSKICNDLRLLSSGPQAGFGEINLPPRAAGSSIMPGKVNPVIPEVVNQVAFEVIGNDMTVTMAAEAGQLQLNAFEPIIAHSLFKSILHLEAALNTLAANCISGITANTERLDNMVRNSVGLVTALNPYIGYENSTRIAKLAHASGCSVASLILQEQLMTEKELDHILSPEFLTRPAPQNKKAISSST